MLYSFNLNINSDWNFLPWKKINTRISIIQHKIYIAAKKYSLKYLYYLQKYLLNSIEVKINAIKYITGKLFMYYKDKNSIKYKFSDKNKFYIFKNLYKKNIDNKFYFIFDGIKQYLIYLCLKPEWQAKFIFNYIKKQNSNTQIINKINYINIYYSYNNIFKYYLNNKYLFLKYLLKKIQCTKYINNLIKINTYYYTYFYSNTFKLKDIDNNLKNIFISIDDLYQLLSNIFLLGLDWYNLCIYKLKILKTSHSFTYQTNYTYLRFLSKIEKNTFLYKNFLYKLINYYYSGNNYQYMYFLKKMFDIINVYLYFYLKKQYRNIYFNFNIIKLNNIYINIFMFNEKIKYLYNI